MDRIILRYERGHYGGKVVYLECNICHNQFRLPAYRLKEPTRGLFCSPKCAYKREGRGNHNRGEKSHVWKGGRIRDSLGYIFIYSPNHPFATAHRGKYVYEHRLVMEKILGRYLKKGEFVHHLNHIPDDNRPENLQLTNPHSHQRNHRLENPHLKDPITGKFVSHISVITHAPASLN